MLVSALMEGVVLPGNIIIILLQDHVRSDAGLHTDGARLLF